MNSADEDEDEDYDVDEELEKAVLAPFTASELSWGRQLMDFVASQYRIESALDEPLSGVVFRSYGDFEPVYNAFFRPRSWRWFEEDDCLRPPPYAFADLKKIAEGVFDRAHQGNFYVPELQWSVSKHSVFPEVTLRGVVHFETNEQYDLAISLFPGVRRELGTVENMEMPDRASTGWLALKTLSLSLPNHPRDWRKLAQKSPWGRPTKKRKR